MSTASIAADVIRAAESASDATPSTPAGSNAHEYVDLARQEFEGYIADDPMSISRRAAAAAMTTLDKRPFVSTAQGMARRQHEPTSRTNQIAREMADLAAWADGEKADPRDKAAMQAHDFAKSVNHSTMESTLPAGGNIFEPGSDEWHQSADSVIDAMSRNSEVLKK
jgi:hypothetical protein